MGELDTQDAAQLIRTLSVVFLNLVPADAEESLSMTTELFLFVQIIYVCFRFNLERLFLKLRFCFRFNLEIFGSNWKMSYGMSFYNSDGNT